MPERGSGQRVPKEFEYCLTTRYGSTAVRCNPAKCLIPDEISDRFGQVAADILDHSPVRSALDVGVGSGIFLASLLMNSADPHRLILRGVDIDKAVIGVAARNVASAARSRKCDIGASFDVADLVDEEIKAGRQYGVVYANLAYLPEGEPVRPEAAQAPKHALYAGADGLDQFRQLVPKLRQLLAPGGVALIRPAKDAEQASSLWALVKSHYPDPFETMLDAVNCLIREHEGLSRTDQSGLERIPDLQGQLRRTVTEARYAPQLNPVLINVIEHNPAHRTTTGIMVWFKCPKYPLPAFQLLPRSCR